MKKILVAMIAMLTLVTTASAQKLNEAERERVIENLINRMKPYGNFYITTTPITWYEYWAVTGVKKHSKGTNVSKAAIVSNNDQANFCNVLNKEAGKTFFILMKKSEALEAHNKGKLHDDVSYISYDHGFYVKMPKSLWNYIR